MPPVAPDARGQRMAGWGKAFVTQEPAIAQDADVSHAQLRALVNSMPTLAWIARPDGWIFWYNQRWYEYTGTTPEMMAGWGWQSVHDPAHLPDVLARWTAAIAQGKRIEMVFPLRGADGIFRPFLTRVEPLRENGVVTGWYGNNTEITEQERTRERQQLLINELNHRVKNTLASIQSMAAQTFVRADPALRRAFDDRLFALAKVHDVLTRESWSHAPIEEIVETAVSHCGREHFDLAGPALKLEPQTAANLALTLHELCTNAVKYGALSTPAGRVALSWDVARSAQDDTMVRLTWREHGGPRVTPPTQTNFGHRMITRVMASERGASVDFAFDPAGVVCTIVFPLGGEIQPTAEDAG